MIYLNAALKYFSHATEGLTSKSNEPDSEWNVNVSDPWALNVAVYVTIKDHYMYLIYIIIIDHTCKREDDLI